MTKIELEKKDYLSGNNEHGPKIDTVPTTNGHTYTEAASNSVSSCY